MQTEERFGRSKMAHNMVQYHKERNSNLDMMIIKFWDILPRSMDYPLVSDLAKELSQIS